MFIALYSFLKGRFSKDAVTEAKANKTKMTREEAFRQMRKIASRKSEE